VTPLVERAPAKINLTLRVVGRRADGYHELESLVAFADLADTLTLEPGDTSTLDVSGRFACNSGDVADNLVMKATAALRQRVEGMTAGRFHLEKNIPVAAGLGGGSADAAAALRLLARANGIALDDARLLDAARATGADVPVCFASKPCVMRGIGERLTFVGLPKVPAVLANPGVALGTGDVFSRLTLSQDGRSIGDVPQAPDALIAFLAEHANDLTEAAIGCAPVIDEVLTALDGLPGSQLARMSGSGATCFALFASPEEAAAAALKLQAGHAGWWIAPVLLS
jgi:4-diphosphocytidyl-2-C-methyl-D-erythritol kinase